MATDVQRYDVQLDENNDLAFGVTGDFIMGPSDEQHIIDTIQAAPGTWKEYPTTGVNIRQDLGGNVDPQQLAKTTKLQLQIDSYNSQAKALLGTDGTLVLNPNVTLNNGSTKINPQIPINP